MKIISHVFRIALAINFYLMAFTGFSQDDCQLINDNDGIKVYSCSVDGSPFNEVRATFTLKSSLNEYMKLVRDVDHYQNWHYKSSNAYILKKFSPLEWIYYKQIKAPWPITNRDVVLRLQLIPAPDKQKLEVLISSLPEYIPKKEGLVRVPYSSSKMVLTVIGQNELAVDYRILADPGGQLPAWVVNLFSSRGPHETFKNMKELLDNNAGLNPETPNE